MRPMMIFAVGMLLIASLAAYMAHGVLGRADERKTGLQAEYSEIAADLRETGTAAKPFEPARLAPYLSVRMEIADYFRRRHDTKDESGFHGLETRNSMLRLLLHGLRAKKMSVGEYVAIGKTWQAALDQPELKDLRAAWIERVTTEEHPNGLPLPPAATPKPDHLGTIVTAQEILIETIEADLLSPTLDEITG